MWSRVKGLLSADSGSEVVRFAVVGVSGVVINNGALYLLHGIVGWPLVFASVVAVEVAIVNNFVWNDLWTFYDRAQTRFRFLRFNLIALGGLAVNVGVLAALVALAGVHYLVANLIAIGAAMAWNFSANARWTWLRSGGAADEPKTSTKRGHIMIDDLVVMPTYNEAANLEMIVERILELRAFGVFVVDDNSPDGTGAIADRLAIENPGRVEVLHRVSKDGLGAAYRAGFEEAYATGASRIYQMDADLSHDPHVLPQLRSALIDGNDLAIGSRYVEGGGVVGWPWWRKGLSRGGSIYAGMILGLDELDLTGGFKGWRRSALEATRVDETRSSGYAFQIETTYRAHLAGARIVEIPIVFADRQHGVSKMGLGIVFEAVRMVPVMRMRRPEVGLARERIESAPSR